MTFYELITRCKNVVLFLRKPRLVFGRIMLIIIFIAFHFFVFLPYINEYNLERVKWINDVINGSYFVMNSIFLNKNAIWTSTLFSYFC